MTTPPTDPTHEATPTDPVLAAVATATAARHQTYESWRQAISQAAAAGILQRDIARTAGCSIGRVKQIAAGKP